MSICAEKFPCHTKTDRSKAVGFANLIMRAGIRYSSFKSDTLRSIFFPIRFIYLYVATYFNKFWLSGAGHRGGAFSKRVYEVERNVHI